jgi:REP element-mobilizing transposase RayT
MSEHTNITSQEGTSHKSKRILRAKWMDYRSPSIMMVTIVTTKRLPLLGKLQGENIILTELGQKVAEEIKRIPTYNGAESIEIYSYVIMPDHVHILLHIHEHLPRHVGYYIRWFKKQCTYIGLALAVPSARNHSPLFAPDYHDRLLKGKNQLSHMVRYIQDNPRRLALKRANKDLFRIRQNQLIGTIQCTVLSHIFLIEHPLRQVLQCSRRLTQEQIDNLKADCLREAADGTVYVTAAISEGEKQIARALREAGFPLIILLEKGFPAPDDPHYSYFKPQGVYFEACAAGKLLLIEPHAEVLERADIVAKTEAKVGHIPHNTQRYRFVAMNRVAEMMAIS